MEGGRVEGFKWRRGEKRETEGIWIWSDIFTYDYSNGDKVAILLMDTQGVFDHQTCMRDGVLIFALSLMMSSVQCYNLLHNIKEDDLNNLQLFAAYGEFFRGKSNETTFQQLLFIIRDWQLGSNYGWSGTQTVETILSTSAEKHNENIRLRDQLKRSFEMINGFLLPSPGDIVKRGDSFTGDLKDVPLEFLENARILTEGLFAPDKLKVKKINGQNLLVKDWPRYLSNYVDAFKGDSVPAVNNIYEVFLTVFFPSFSCNKY